MASGAFGTRGGYEDPEPVEKLRGPPGSAGPSATGILAYRWNAVYSLPKMSHLQRRTLQSHELRRTSESVVAPVWREISSSQYVK